MSQEYLTNIKNKIAENHSNAAALLPEIKEKCKEVNERQIYKLLYPLARYSLNDELEDVIRN